MLGVNQIQINELLSMIQNNQVVMVFIKLQSTNIFIFNLIKRNLIYNSYFE